MVSLGVFSAYSKTVALWPIDYTESGFDGRNCIEGGGDLASAGTVVGTDGAFEGLPANVDRSLNLSEPPVNNNTGCQASGSGGRFHCSDSRILETLNRTNESFTVEGWMKFGSLPTSGWWVLYNVLGAKEDNRWLFSIRYGGKVANGVSLEIYDGGSGKSGDKLLLPVDDQLKDTLTNEWNHIAIVHNLVEGNSRYSLYLNGELKSGIDGGKPGQYAMQSLEIGGRQNGNVADVQWDYIRVSDRALHPGEFLCDEGAAVEVPVKTASSTVAYWKLDQKADGSLNLTDEIRGAKLTHCAYKNLYGFVASGRKAHEGHPPNQLLAKANNGSAYNGGNVSCMKVHDIGRTLSLSNDFSVEMYLAPTFCAHEGESQWIFDTRRYNNGKESGCLLALTRKNGQRYFYLYDSEHWANPRLCDDDLSDWYDAFRHVALTYDADGGADGHGVYRFYMDGVLKREIVNTRSALDYGGNYGLEMFGQITRPDRSFHGYVDTVRICSAALSPNQFMCATEGKEAVAAESIVALWPFDVGEDEIVAGERVIDLRNDAIGGTVYFARQTDYAGNGKMPVADAARKPASIPNPEPSIFYTNDATQVNASATFSESSPSRKYVMTCDYDVVNALKGDAFTIEGYFYHGDTLNDNWSILVNPIVYDGTCQMVAPGTYKGLSYRNQTSNKGYNIWFGGAGDRYFNVNGTDEDGKSVEDEGNQVVVDPGVAQHEWRHVALVYRKADPAFENKNTMTLYVNGVRQSTISHESASWASYNELCGFAIGGRPTGNQSVFSVSSLRISDKALGPGEFLCAQGVTPPPVVRADKATVSYWKLDAVGDGGIDMTSSVNDAFGFATTEGMPLGSVADQAVNVVPNPDKTVGFVGDPRSNAGSLDFDGSSLLPVQYLGYSLDLYRADAGFTVEGWLKWRGDETGKDETIVQVSGFTSSSAHWRLSLDATGTTPRMKVSAVSADVGRVPYVDRTFDFDASVLKGAWNHIALVYSAHEGNGTWTLIVNKRDSYVLENAQKIRQLLDIPLFTLGGARSGVDGFTGLLDCWRVSRGCLAADELLFDTPKGTLFIVR